jgi:hypothetical protein
MGFVDKSQWSTAVELPAEHVIGPRNCFFTWHMTILNAFLIRKSCGGKMTHKNFGNWLSIHKRKMWQLVVAFQGSNQVQMRCRVCSLHKQTRSMLSFLQEEGRWSVSSELRKSPLHKKRRVVCVGVRQIISFYSEGRKHLPCK